MGLGFPIFRKAVPKEPTRNIKMSMPGYLLGYLLEGELLVDGLFFLMVTLVFPLLVPVVFGKEGQEGIPEFLLVVRRVFQQLIQLHQVRYAKVQTLKEHQGGEQDRCQPIHRFKCTNYLPTRRFERKVACPAKLGVAPWYKYDHYQQETVC